MHIWMFNYMQKFIVFAILPERIVQSGELFIGQVWVGRVNSELDLGQRLPADNLFLNRHGTTEWVELTESRQCR